MGALDAAARGLGVALGLALGGCAADPKVPPGSSATDLDTGQPAPFSATPWAAGAGPPAVPSAPTATTTTTQAPVGRPRLWVDPLVPGATLDLEAGGAPPGAEIVFVVGRLGPPACPPFLAGGCVDVRGPAELGRAFAGVDGVARLRVVLDAAAPEGEWYVFDAAEPGAGFSTPIALRRTEPEPVPTNDYSDPFEPNSHRPAEVVAGSLFSLTVRAGERLEDRWADAYAIETPPNREVVWRLAFATGSAYWTVLAGGPDGAVGEQVLATFSDFELRTRSTVGGHHTLRIASEEYAFPRSVYDLHVEVLAGPPVDWYPDADGDGAADPSAQPVFGVDPPYDGWLAAATDCDDGDPEVFPGAPERCGDGVGQGCGADRPCSVPPTGSVASTDVGTVLSGFPQFGVDGVAGGDLDGDGVADLAVAERAGVAVFAGPIDADAPSSVSVGRVAIDGNGYAIGVAVLGDVNGDGIGDLAVAASFADVPAAGVAAGAVAVLFGPISGFTRAEDAPVQLLGSRGGDHAGTTVHALGDVNGDGLADLLIGSSEQDAYAVHSPVPARLSLADADLVQEGIVDVGVIGDADGDGVPEFAATTGPEDVLVLDGGLVGRVGPDAAKAEIQGAWFTGGVPRVGDIDGDGLADLVRAGDDEEVGYVYLAPFAALVTAPDATITSADGVEFHAEWIAGAGDLDQDGFADLVVASHGPVANQAGRIHLVTGPILGVRAVEDSVAIDGVSPETFQWTPTGVGDVSGDGFDDVAIGIDRVDVGAGSYVYHDDVVIVSGAGL